MARRTPRIWPTSSTRCEPISRRPRCPSSSGASPTFPSIVVFPRSRRSGLRRKPCRASLATPRGSTPTTSRRVPPRHITARRDNSYWARASPTSSPTTRYPNPAAIPTRTPIPCPSPCSGTMGVQFDAGSGTLGANNNTVGWRFKAGQDLSVTRLGCLNGVVTTDDTRAGVPHAVGIYSEATGQLLGSAVVVNGAAGSTEQWLWTDLATPITLTAGSIYRIAANPNGDKWTFNTANHSVGPGILIGTDLAPGVPLTDDPGSRIAAYEAGNLLQYPGQLLWDAEVIYDGIFGPNFKYEDAAAPGPRGVHGTGTHMTGVTAPSLPANNLIVQGSDTFSHSFSGGAAAGEVGRAVVRYEQRSHDGRECRRYHDSRVGRGDARLRLGRLRPGHHHQHARLRRERDPLLCRLHRREDQSGCRDQVRLGRRHHHRRQRTAADARLVQLLAEQEYQRVRLQHPVDHQRRRSHGAFGHLGHRSQVHRQPVQCGPPVVWASAITRLTSNSP